MISTVNSFFIKYRAMQKTAKKVHSKSKDQVDLPNFSDFTPCHFGNLLTYMTMACSKGGKGLLSSFQ